MRDKFLEHGIPYDNIDPEMRELIDVLNFHLGFTTRFCCYGHDDWTSPYVIFDDSVRDEQIYSLASVVCKDWKDFIHFNKWVRNRGGEVASSWTMDIRKLFKNDTPAKLQHLKRVVEVFKSA